MELLKVGDKVYYKDHSRWTNFVTYKFATVDRLTKTQAILSNGTKLINEPTNDNHDKVFGYSTYGDKWSKWYVQTPEILEEARLEKERQAIVRWFNDRKFSEEEKRIIYNKFKELNILDSAVQK